MNEPRECPSADEFACFIDGQVEPAAAERIRAHLDACYSCQLLVGKALRAESATGEPRTFPVGEVLNGRFRIEGFIARGGMGEVYEAWDLQLRETIALKTIVCTGLDNVRLFPRIRAEVQLARRVTHPNVCRILEFGVAEARDPDRLERVPFFTMEYLRGSTLRERLNLHGPLPESEVIALVLQILDGLAAVHAAGIVHRDLKPENVFVVPAGAGGVRAVVMDFGLARSTIGSDSRSSFSNDVLVGSPAYMAPEQTIGEQPAPAWDIYALGVIVFELLTGTLPFSGRNAIAMAMARVEKPAPSLSSVLPNVRPELEAAVACCLQTDPKRRFTGAEAVRHAFEGVRTAPRRHRGVPLRARSLAAAAIAAAILSAFVVLRWSRAADAVSRKPFGTRSGTQNPNEAGAVAPTAPASSVAHPTSSSENREAAMTRRGPPEIERQPNRAGSQQIVRASRRSIDGSRFRVEPVPADSALNAHGEASSPAIRELPDKPGHLDEIAIPAFAQPTTQGIPNAAP